MITSNRITSVRKIIVTGHIHFGTVGIHMLPLRAFINPVCSIKAFHFSQWQIFDKFFSITSQHKNIILF